jgi:hypothetical protein
LAEGILGKGFDKISDASLELFAVWDLLLDPEQIFLLKGKIGIYHTHILPRACV